MNTNKAAGLDWAVTAEALRAGFDPYIIHIIHKFSVEVFTTLSPPYQWTTNVILPLPKKGDPSLMTNYRGITLTPKYTERSCLTEFGRSLTQY